MPQERYNTEWLIEKGVGVTIPNFRGIARAVDRLLEPATYAKYRAATEKLDNRAVFEITSILEQILAESSQEMTPLRTA
jgi:1,2-diacylglycerol 3-beta-galactosyltransferase